MQGDSLHRYHSMILWYNLAMKLIINTENSKLVKVALGNESQRVATLSDENEWGSQVLLPLIEKILKENGVEYKDLDEVLISTGPGSFTGLRVGVSVANALGYSLGIPVNGKKMEVELEY